MAQRRHRDHQVVSTTGTFASPVLRPGRTYSFTFDVAGSYRYRDALHPRVTGTVRVAGAPPALTLATSLPQISYSAKVILSGQVNNKRAGEQVQIVHQPYGQASQLVSPPSSPARTAPSTSPRNRRS